MVTKLCFSSFDGFVCVYTPHFDRKPAVRYTDVIFLEMLCLKYHNVLKCFVRPLNVHFSSNRNRNVTSEWTLIRQTLDQDRLPTTKEWTELREKLRSMKRSNNYNNTSNFDRIIVGCCLPTQLDIGKSYVKHLKESGTELNTGTLVDLLKLYYRASKAGTEITPNDQQEIINMLVTVYQK